MPYAGWGECRWSADPNDDRPVHTQERFHDTLGTAMTLAIALRAGGLHPSRTHPLFWSSGRRHLLRDRWLRHEQRSKGFPSKTIGLPPQYSCDVCPRSMHSEVHGIDMVWYGINYGLVEWCHHIWSSLYCTYAFAMYIFTMNTCHHSPFSRPGPLSEHSIFIYSPAGSQMTTASSIHTRRQ